MSEGVALQDSQVVLSQNEEARMLTEEQWKSLFLLRDAFFEKTEGFKPFGYQKEFSDAVIRSVILNDGKRIVAEFSRQSGKTRTIMFTVKFLLNYYFDLCDLFSLPRHGFFNVGIFGPQTEQARTDFTILRDSLYSSGLRTKTTSELSSKIISYGSGTEKVMVYCMSASPDSHQESKTLSLIILEEAQDLIDHQVRKAILPMGAATNATVVYIGVGGYRTCDFQMLLNSLPPEQKFINPYVLVQDAWNERFEETGESPLAELRIAHKRDDDEERGEQ